MSFPIARDSHRTVCKTCGVALDDTNRVPNKGGRGVPFRSHCRTCYQKSVNKYRQATADRLKAERAAFRAAPGPGRPPTSTGQRCTVCQSWYRGDAFEDGGEMHDTCIYCRSVLASRVREARQMQADKRAELEVRTAFVGVPGRGTDARGYDSALGAYRVELR